MTARRMVMVTSGSSWIVSRADWMASIVISNGTATATSQDKPLVELKGKKLVYKEDTAPWSLPKRREPLTRPE